MPIARQHGLPTSGRHRHPDKTINRTHAAVESGLADRVIAALDQLVLDLQRKDRLDLSLAYARGVPWISEVVLGAETAEQVSLRKHKRNRNVNVNVNVNVT
jgi:hypothetical protein